MKPLEERSQYVDYMTGKQIPAREFIGGMDIFSDYVWPDVLKEHAGRQLSLQIEGFEGDVYYTKNRPIELKSKEALHLARREEPKSPVLGLTMSQTDRFDRAMEAQAIGEIKSELSNMV